jgi:hypothetical protein
VQRAAEFVKKLIGIERRAQAPGNRLIERAECLVGADHHGDFLWQRGNRGAAVPKTRHYSAAAEISGAIISSKS